MTCVLCWNPGKKHRALLGNVVILDKSLHLSGPQSLGRWEKAEPWVLLISLRVLTDLLSFCDLLVLE